MEIHSGSRTLEAPRGNRYAPARGMLVMMMKLSLLWIRSVVELFFNVFGEM